MKYFLYVLHPYFKSLLEFTFFLLHTCQLENGSTNEPQSNMLRSWGIFLEKNDENSCHLASACLNPLAEVTLMKYCRCLNETFKNTIKEVGATSVKLHGYC